MELRYGNKYKTERSLLQCSWRHSSKFSSPHELNRSSVMRSDDAALENMVRRERWVGGEVKGILVWSEWGAYFFMEDVEG